MTCKHRRQEIDCPYCRTSVAWAIVKHAKMLRESGHAVAVGWARGELGLEDRDKVVGTRNVEEPE